MRIVLAEVSARHFQFQAVGYTHEECRTALKEAWEVHCRDYPDAQMDFMQWCLDNEEVNFTVTTIGGVLRDGETIL